MIFALKIKIITWASIYTLMTSDKGWLLMHNTEYIILPQKYHSALWQ